MFPGSPRNRENCRVYTVAVVGNQIALKGDDPDFILLETTSASTQNIATVTLPNTAPIGKTFTFILVGHPQIVPSITAQNVTVKVPCNRKGGTSVLGYTVSAGQEARFLYTPNGWLTPRGANLGSDTADTSQGIAVGEASAGQLGIGIGTVAVGHTGGVAVGYSAQGSASGVAVGNSATATTNGVAVGRQASSNSKDAAVALGYLSKAERYRELVKSADRATTCLQSLSILSWFGDTANATPTEILLGGTASQFAVLLNSSAIMFRLSAAARNNADDVTSVWSLTGGIKRGANAAATALVGTVTKTIIGADAGAVTWDIAATADTTNGSLMITVTGEAAKTIRWNVRGDISELRF